MKPSVSLDSFSFLWPPEHQMAFNRPWRPQRFMNDLGPPLGVSLAREIAYQYGLSFDQICEKVKASRQQGESE